MQGFTGYIVIMYFRGTHLANTVMTTDKSWHLRGEDGTTDRANCEE